MSLDTGCTACRSTAGVSSKPSDWLESPPAVPHRDFLSKLGLLVALRFFLDRLPRKLRTRQSAHAQLLLRKSFSLLFLLVLYWTVRLHTCAPFRVVPCTLSD